MDNSTAEYTFLSTFFNVPPLSRDTKQPLLSPAGFRSSDALEARTSSTSEFGGRVVSNSSATFSDLAAVRSTKEEQANHDAFWKQIFDPVLEYCKASIRYFLDTSC
jgi:hypothetical protein